MRRLTGLGVALAMLPGAGLGAQQARTAVVPQSVTIGDIFRVAVRVAVPAGAVVVFPDTLDVPESVEAAARREVTVDSTRPELRTYTAVFPLTAWKPGTVQLPPARVRLELPDGGNFVEATFPAVSVTSVLPPDTAAIEPKPAKDVIGPSRLLWPTALGIGLLAALLLLAIWIYRRRRPAPVRVAGVPPRYAALAELDRIRRLGYLERGDLKAFYSAITAVLRTYTATLDARWSPDLTTTELERAMTLAAVAWAAVESDRAAAPVTRDTGLEEPVGEAAEPRVHAPVPVTSEAIVEMTSLLNRSDLVKFAGRRPPVSEAERAWTESRRWVEAYPPGSAEALEAA